MIKPTVKRGLMLDFIGDEVKLCMRTNENRVHKLNKKPISNGNIVYIASRELRLEDNWAVIYGFELAQKYNKKFQVYINTGEKICSKRQQPFLEKNLDTFKDNLSLNNIKFDIYTKMPENAGAFIVDFNPVDLKNSFAKSANCAVFEVDSHNIIPARFISNKQEFSAAILRRKVYLNIAEYLTEFPDLFRIKKCEAKEVLDDFVDNKFELYAEFKNNSQMDVTSHLSTYMHFGFISSQKIAIEILKSKTSRYNKEAFLEELIVRKELSDNFCLYAKDYKSFKSAPNWAVASLNSHKNDLRSYIYNLNEFEQGETHDKAWNEMQIGLVKTGRIHGYLRMYWAKKILEWSKTPNDALKTAIYLNDKYALDGNDPNGYVGILWSIAGLHDRPFADRLVTGKIRYMKNIVVK